MRKILVVSGAFHDFAAKILRLAAERRALGLSQRKMAEELRVDPGTLQGWEAGRHQPTRKYLEMVGRVLQSRER